MPLYFKSNEAAFEMACKYLDCSVYEGAHLPALVLDAAAMYGLPEAVKKRDDGSQTAVVQIASDEGQFIVPAATLAGSNGPDIKPGDLVEWCALKYSKKYGQ